MIKRLSASIIIIFALLLAMLPAGTSAQAAKTHVADTARDAAGNPLSGKITFLLTQKSASAPDGLVVASPSVSAVLDGAGHFDVYLYPSVSLSPVCYYQAWATSGAGNQTFLGVYNIPSSASAVTLAPYRVTDTNLAAQYTFASLPSVLALTSAVSTATSESLLIATTSGTIPKRVTAGLADSALSETSTQVNSTKTVVAPGFVGSGAGLTGVTAAGVGGSSSPGSLSLIANSGDSAPGTVIDFFPGGPAAGSKFRVGNDGTLSGSGVDALLADVERCKSSEGCFDANAPPYSAVPNVTADQTAAIQACINDAMAYAAVHGTAVIRLASGKYRISSALTQNGVYNAQVTIPVVSSGAPRAAVTIESKSQSHSPFPFLGGGGSVIFESTMTGQSYSPTYGKPFVMAGPDVIHGTSPSLASYVSLRLRGIGFRAPQDPSIGGFNGEMIDQVTFDGCAWGTTDPNLGTASQVVPTHPSGIAVLGPREFFEGTMWLGTNTVVGWYAGFGVDEYTNGVGDMFAAQNVVNFNVAGSYFVAPTINIATSTRGKYDIAHVDPQVGVSAMPAGLALTGFLPFYANMRIEDGPAPWAKINHVYDPTNQLRGRLTVSRNISSTGLIATRLNNAGGLLLDVSALEGPSLQRRLVKSQFNAPSGTALSSIPFAANVPRAPWSGWAGGFNADGFGGVVGTNASYNRAVVDTGSADGLLTLRCLFPAGSGSAGFIFRASDSSHYYYFEIDYLGNYGVVKVVAGVGTLVAGSGGTAGGTANPFAVGTEVPFGVAMTGDRIRILMNDNALVSFTDSFNDTAQQHGIQTNNTAAVVSDFTFTR